MGIELYHKKIYSGIINIETSFQVYSIIPEQKPDILHFP